ncbi:MAG: sulfurtransferase-like selenium metabolism protein YedF [Eubacteriales bacterium]|nr:sulfurtransferase-like selenium metabolism protein YedF [Eubacteriales bacterium]
MHEPIIVDARGQACPFPVVMTKKALAENPDCQDFLIQVDNQVASQNVSKYAQSQGAESRVESSSEDLIEVKISRSGSGKTSPFSAKALPEPVQSKAKRVVLIGSEQMGSGDDRLGDKLIASFLFALSQQDELCDQLIFYNTGVKLCCRASAVIEDLKTLSANGVKVIACGTCLEHFGLKEELEIGEISNMYDIVEILMTAAVVIRP